MNLILCSFVENWFQIFSTPKNICCDCNVGVWAGWCCYWAARVRLLGRWPWWWVAAVAAAGRSSPLAGGPRRARARTRAWDGGRSQSQRYTHAITIHIPSHGDPHRHQPPLHHSPLCSAPDKIIIIVFKYLPTSPSIILIPLYYLENPKDNNWLCRKIFGIYDILYIVPPVRNKFTRHILKREATPFKNFMQIDNLTVNIIRTI